MRAERAARRGAALRARLLRWWQRYQGRVDDVVCMSLVACGGLVGVISAVKNPGERDGVWVHSALTLAVVVVLWWRRRVPLRMFVLTSALVVLGATSMTLWVMLLTVAVRTRGRVLAAAALVAAAVFVGRFWGTSSPSGFFEWAVFAGVCASGVALPVLAGAYIGTRRDLVRTLRDRVQQAEAEQVLRVAQAQLGERTRIAREMHDVLAHRISLVALHAGGLEVNPGADAGAVERTAALIRSNAREALEELRGVLGVLRTESVTGSESAVDRAPQPSLLDVAALVRASSAAGVSVQLHDDLPPGAVAPLLIARTAYRVVQEALTNVHKHADGAPTTVRLSGGPGAALRVQVCSASAGVSPSAGPGAAPIPGSGLGLVGLRERVELAGGELDASPTARGGFVVDAELPWPLVAGSST